MQMRLERLFRATAVLVGVAQIGQQLAPADLDP
jgi:hypothetical protein